MEVNKATGVAVERINISSKFLQRDVMVDYYLPEEFAEENELSLLLINDGQDLEKMEFHQILTDVLMQHDLRPLLCVGIHCSEDRMNEYGMAAGPDYQGRGSKGAVYQQFIREELIPAVEEHFAEKTFVEKCFAGFSLGALSALDITWNHADLFKKVGVFSGSLWWRSKSKDHKDYNQNTDRLMHAQVRKGNYKPGLKFFFQCGELDESEDRNRNGVIDSIDDTIDMMRELYFKGYKEGKDMYYLQLPDGRHDVESWAKAFPLFLRWAFRASSQ